MLLDASLWPNVERRLSDELGAPLRPLDQLGRPRENRITWAADADGIGEVIVKARFRDRAGAKTRWCARNLPLLAARGYPVPEYLWFGPLDRDWYLVVQRRLLGHPTQKPDEQLLGELLSLVELQADAGIPRSCPGGPHGRSFTPRASRPTLHSCRRALPAGRRTPTEPGSVRRVPRR